MSGPDVHSGFTAALLDAVAGGTESNVLISPWSVSSALAVVAAAADGTPRTEIEQALAAGGEPGGVVDRLAASAQDVVTRPAYDETVLAVTNTLWVDDGSTPSARFLSTQARWPGAALRTAPLRAAPESARATINRDVAATTRDLIPELLPPGSIHPDDRAVVVNALYLLAAWTMPFTPEQTVDEPFATPSGTRPVPTMRGTRVAAYAAARDGAEYLALKLSASLDVEILLPRPGAPPTDPRLDPVRLAAQRTQATDHDVDLHLPRVRLSWMDDIAAILRRLGIAEVFDREVLRLVEEEPLRIARVIHGAVLRLDEQGVEAAAATAMTLRTVSLTPPRPHVEVRVDRPFVLLVTHRPTRAVLFAARVVDPAESQS